MNIQWNIRSFFRICLLAGHLSLSIAVPSVAQRAPCDNTVSLLEKKSFSLLKSENAQTGNYDLVYARLDLKINPASDSVSGSVTHYFSPLISGFNSLSLDCSGFLTVDSVIFHGIPAGYTHISNVLEVSTGPLLPSSVDSLTVWYHGIPDASGFGSFTRTYHGNTPIAWTLSEPHGAADWWPCKNNLGDKLDSADIIITSPLQFRTASNGILLGETVSGGKRTCHWKTTYPVATYLIGISVTNYAVYSDWFVKNGSDSLRILNYVYPEDSASLRTKTPDIIDILHLYDSLTVPYPFSREKYGQAQFGWGGGMEHQTMSFIGGFSHELMAHECAHQWFGDKVTCRSWEDIWLNEGFATYLEGLTEERYFPGTWWTWKSAKIGSITSSPGGSVRCTDTTDINRIFDGRLTYNKGAYLLQMLRWVLGDTAFFTGIKNYLNDPALAYGFVTTPDLRSHLEAASSTNLQNFFDTWYYGAGYPSYDVRWNQQDDLLSVEISQTTSDPSVTFFSMPVPILFSDGTQDTILVFHHSHNHQVFSVSILFHPVLAVFDPDLRILSANNRVSHGPVDLEKLPDLFTLYPNPASGQIQIGFAFNTYHKSKILRLYAADGRLLLTAATGEMEYTLLLPRLSNGIYFLEADMGMEKEVKKLMIFHGK